MVKEADPPHITFATTHIIAPAVPRFAKEFFLVRCPRHRPTVPDTLTPERRSSSTPYDVKRRRSTKPLVVCAFEIQDVGRRWTSASGVILKSCNV